jgi:hypothetical protein
VKTLANLTAGAWAVALLVLLGGAGCKPEQVAKYAEAGRDVATYAEACAVAAKAVDDARCHGDPGCLQSMIDKYAGIADALDKMHAIWCDFAPKSEGCER